jgi:spore germination protein GerM
MTRRSLVGGILASLLLLGCGLPEDDGPQAIAPENLPPDLLDPDPGSSTTLPQSAETSTVIVYLLEETANGVRLAEVEREVTQANHPRGRLAALFAGLDEDEPDAGLSTQIPADTVLLGVETSAETDEVLVNVSGDLLTIEGEALAQAFAQIVWTATEPSAGGFNFVRFLVDGTPRTVIDGDGVEQEGAVDRADFSSFSPR